MASSQNEKKIPFHFKGQGKYEPCLESFYDDEVKPFLVENLVLIRNTFRYEYPECKTYYFIRRHINPWRAVINFSSESYWGTSKLIACCPYNPLFEGKLLEKHPKLSDLFGRKEKEKKNTSSTLPTTKHVLPEGNENYIYGGAMITEDEMSVLLKQFEEQNRLFEPQLPLLDLKESDYVDKDYSDDYIRKLAYSRLWRNATTSSPDDQVLQPKKIPKFVIPNADVTTPVPGVHNWYLIGSTYSGYFKLGNTSEIGDRNNSNGKEIVAYCPNDSSLKEYVSELHKYITKSEGYYKLDEREYLALIHDFRLRRNRIISIKSRRVLQFEKEVFSLGSLIIDQYLGSDYKLIITKDPDFRDWYYGCIVKLSYDEIIVYGDISLYSFSEWKLDNLMDLKNYHSLLSENPLHEVLKKFNVTISTPEEFYSTLPTTATPLLERMEKLKNMREKGKEFLSNLRLIYTCKYGDIYTKNSPDEPSVICIDGLIIRTKKNWSYHYDLANETYRSNSCDLSLAEDPHNKGRVHGFNLYSLMNMAVLQNEEIRTQCKEDSCVRQIYSETEEEVGRINEIKDYADKMGLFKEISEVSEMPVNEATEESEKNKIVKEKEEQKSKKIDGSTEKEVTCDE